VPGAVEFTYDMKDAENELARAFRVDRTIEVVAGKPQ
jgi:hypothetical protein